MESQTNTEQITEPTIPAEYESKLTSFLASSDRIKLSMPVALTGRQVNTECKPDEFVVCDEWSGFFNDLRFSAILRHNGLVDYGLEVYDRYNIEHFYLLSSVSEINKLDITRAVSAFNEEEKQSLRSLLSNLSYLKFSIELLNNKYNFTLTIKPSVPEHSQETRELVVSKKNIFDKNNVLGILDALNIWSLIPQSFNHEFSLMQEGSTIWVELTATEEVKELKNTSWTTEVTK